MFQSTNEAWVVGSWDSDLTDNENCGAWYDGTFVTARNHPYDHDFDPDTPGRTALQALTSATRRCYLGGDDFLSPTNQFVVTDGKGVLLPYNGNPIPGLAARPDALLPFVPGKVWDGIARRLGGRSEAGRLDFVDEAPLPGTLSGSFSGSHSESVFGSFSRSLRRTVVCTSVPTLLLAYVLVGNLETLRSEQFLPQGVHHFAAALGVEQGWGMYASSPYLEPFHVVTRAVGADGSRMLLDSGIGGGDAEWAPVARSRSDYRGKMLLEAVANWVPLRRSYALWICERWMANSEGAGPLRSVSVEVERTPLHLGGRIGNPRTEPGITERCF